MYVPEDMKDVHGILNRVIAQNNGIDLITEYGQSELTMVDALDTTVNLARISPDRAVALVIEVCEFLSTKFNNGFFIHSLASANTFGGEPDITCGLIPPAMADNLTSPAGVADELFQDFSLRKDCAVDSYEVKHNKDWAKLCFEALTEIQSRERR